jgi:hypothetical protein
LIPDPWEFVLLSLAAYRTWRLLAEDTLLDRPRSWLLGTPGWKPVASETPPDGYRAELAYWISCPFCAGFWWATAWWAAWIFGGDWALLAATPWAVSAVVALVAKNLDE